MAKSDWWSGEKNGKPGSTTGSTSAKKRKGSKKSSTAVGGVANTNPSPLNKKNGGTQSGQGKGGNVIGVFGQANKPSSTTAAGVKAAKKGVPFGTPGVGYKKKTGTDYNGPPMIGTPVPTMQNANALTGELIGGNSEYDQLLRKILAYQEDTAKANKGTSFKGNLQDYVKQAEGNLPKVSYDALIKAAKKTEKTNSGDIGDVYSGLGAYVQGAGKNLNANTAAGAEDLKANAQAAADLISQSSAAGTAQNNDIFSAAGLGSLGDPNATQGAQTAKQVQNDNVSAIGNRLQAELGNNTARGQSNFARNSDMGVIGQQQGAESQAALKQVLLQQLAEYRTSASQQNAQNALQALQMGQSQYNTDRSYAQSEASNRANQQSNALNIMLTQLGLLDGSDVDSPKYAANLLAAQQQKDAADLAQQNTGIKQGLDAAGQRAKAITALKAAGYDPIKDPDSWAQALSAFGFSS